MRRQRLATDPTSPEQPVNHLRARQYFSASFPLYIAESQQTAMAEHSHEFFEMVYVRRGCGWHFIEGERYPIKAGDLYVISPDEKHGYAPLQNEAMAIVNILWMPSLVEDVLRATSRTRGRADSSTRSGEKSLSGARQLLYVEPVLRKETRFTRRLQLSGKTALRVELLIDEMCREQAQAAAGCELLLRHLFCALLVLLSRSYDEQNERALTRIEAPRVSPQEKIVSYAIEYIEENYARPMRVSEVAAHVALSSSRLAHIFKQHTRRGINEYLHEYRIARACTALMESNAAVGEIAADVGYSDARFFHRVFRRYTGCNPTQYREHCAPFQTAAS
jgi:AraC-like DNA-binding protein/mannose-6-phosphate isomerase-like protein (cupin superfamily)